MAVGSLVTVAVLAVAALQGPKWFNGSEASTTQTTQIAPPQESMQQPPTAPATSANAVPEPAPSAATTTSPTVTPDPPRTVPQNLKPVRPGTETAAPQTPVQVAQNTVPSQQAQVQPPVGQPAVQQAPTSVPAVDTAALREARDHLRLLGSRANSARSTLMRMKEQQAKQGLGMRGDISTAEQRMEGFLDDAEDAIKAGELELAKKALANAEREIDRLDTFLGR